MKIFVSIASYQDPLLESTILSAYRNAEKPENSVSGAIGSGIARLCKKPEIGILLGFTLSLLFFA